MSKVKKKYLKAATVALTQWLDSGALMRGYWGTKVPDEGALLQAVALLLQEHQEPKEQSVAGKGKVFPEWWVICGRCEANTPADFDSPPRTRPAAERELKKMGWQKGNVYGWLCPDCWEKGAR